MYEPTPRKVCQAQVVQPLVITYKPSRPTVQYLGLTLNGGMLARSPALNCSVSVNGAANVPCYATMDNEDITVTNVSMNISIFPENNTTKMATGSTYVVKIWTLGAEDGINGFVSPVSSAWIPIDIVGKDESLSAAESMTDFLYIRACPLGYFEVTAAIRNYNLKNLFTVKFYLPAGKSLNAYNHPTNPGRIFIQFPTTNLFA